MRGKSNGEQTCLNEIKRSGKITPQKLSKKVESMLSSKALKRTFVNKRVQKIHLKDGDRKVASIILSREEPRQLLRGTEKRDITVRRIRIPKKFNSHISQRTLDKARTN